MEITRLKFIIESLSFLFKPDRFPSLKEEFDELCRLAFVGYMAENNEKNSL